MRIYRNVHAWTRRRCTRYPNMEWMKRRSGNWNTSIQLCTAAATARNSDMMLHCSFGFLIYLTAKYERSTIESAVINGDLWRIWKGIILMCHPSTHLTKSRFITALVVKCGTKQITEKILNPNVLSGGWGRYGVQFLLQLYICYITSCFFWRSSIRWHPL
jgi:hypothetical protein